MAEARNSNEISIAPASSSRTRRRQPRNKNGNCSYQKETTDTTPLNLNAPEFIPGVEWKMTSKMEPRTKSNGTSRSWPDRKWREMSDAESGSNGNSHGTKSKNVDDHFPADSDDEEWPALSGVNGHGDMMGTDNRISKDVNKPKGAWGQKTINFHETPRPREVPKPEDSSPLNLSLASFPAL